MAGRRTSSSFEYFERPARKIETQHQTRFELAFPSPPSAAHTRGLTAAPPHVGNVFQSLNSLMFTRFTVRRGA